MVLDFLATHKNCVFVTNNLYKTGMLEEFGYGVERIKLLGTVNTAGAKEARERGTEFGHLDICDIPVTFGDEFDRLKKEIQSRMAWKDSDPAE